MEGKKIERVMLFGVAITSDGVDTSLTLSIRSPSDDERKTKRPKINPTLLPCFHAGLGFLNLQEPENSVSRNRRNKSDDDDDDNEPNPPQGLLRAVMPCTRNGLVFLYNKILKESDVKPGLNRLFVTRRNKLMSFLTEGERDAVGDKNRGLDISTVDSDERTYTLHLALWPSLKMLVLNSDWMKLVLDNNVQNGQEVQVWGYRRNGELSFAVNFGL